MRRATMIPCSRPWTRAATKLAESQEPDVEPFGAVPERGRTSRTGEPVPLLRVTELRKSYQTPQGPLPVLKGVDLTLEAGTSLALLGESGSGKSTLLHLIGGLDEADGGEIWIDGVLCHGPRRCGARGAPARAARRRVSAVQPHSEPDGRGQSRVSGAARGPA